MAGCDTGRMDSTDPIGSPDGIVAELKGILYHWWQEEPAVGATHFGVTAQVLVGEAVGEMADSFDLVLCSPSMFSERYSAERWGSGFAEHVLPGGEVLPLVGVWLMRRWSPQAFEAAARRLLIA